MLHYNRSICYLRENKLEEALSDADQAVELADEPNLAKAYIRRAGILKSLNRYNESIRDYQKALELNPADDQV